MSEPYPEGQDPYKNARTEIDSWRGRCLDLYARSEKAVALTLETAKQHDHPVKLRHLAGQRLDDLLSITDQDNGTAKQKEALARAIDGWRAIESHRVFLAHGTMKELLDRKGKWHAQFDVTTYKSNNPTPDRMMISQTEALELQADLEKGFKSLSAQLGQFRKRLAT
ncbi:MAG: hypothetical protein APF78_11230 [Sphingomonadales bacterium BRH_c3]|nr:MAG: hypothetical protein APF78_11230 [Sphingomonadales bacterium BRH_c3]